MFGFLKVAKAEKAAVQALRPFVQRHLEPWPPSFWRDPFVLGFLMVVIAKVGRFETNGKLTTEQTGRVLIRTIDSVGGKSSDFNDRIAHLSKERDPDFFQGAENAKIIVDYIYGAAPLDTHPAVVAATRLAEGLSMDGRIDRDSIAGGLIHSLFVEVVQKRLGS